MTLVSLDGLVVVAFAALLGLVAMLLLRATIAGETQEVTRNLQCPVLDRPARCVLVRDVRSGRLTAVSLCSLRSPATAPCSADCARLLELGARLKPRHADAGPKKGRGPR